MSNETSLSNTILVTVASLNSSEKFANLGQLLKILLIFKNVLIIVGVRYVFLKVILISFSP